MLIQAALNGGTTRDRHPAVPLKPAELASEARAAQLAGAGAFHLHPRDESGEQTLAAEHVLAAVAAVRAATGLPVGVTTGIWTVDGDVNRRLALVERWTGPDRPDYASINMNEPGIGELADLLTGLGVGIEAGVWTAEDARVLRASGFSDRILWVLLEPEAGGAPPARSCWASRRGRCVTGTTSPPGTCCAPRSPTARTSGSGLRTRRSSLTARRPRGTATWSPPRPA
jgi:uncharacterized protein (DUF849 family)